MIRKLVLALALVLAPLSIARATPATNQLVRCQDLVAAVGAGTLTWAGASQTCANNNAIVSRSTFISWISNTGSCAGSGDYVLRYGDMLNCKSGGTAAQQSENATFYGSATGDNIHGVCSIQTNAIASYTTGTAVAPTSSAHQIEWLANGTSTQAITLNFYNPSSTLVQSYSVPLHSTSAYTYSNSSAPAGVYTVTETGLTNYACPTIGGPNYMQGTLYWYQ